MRPPGCVRRPCALLRAAFGCLRQRGSQALTGGGWNACAATWPGRPWREGVCALSMPTLFPSRSKRRGLDGTRPLLLSPMELLEKRAALVPPPRFHLLRYHGVLAPRARARDRIVPAKAGWRAGGGRRLDERCGLRPSTALGDPAGAGVFLRPQRMRGLWPAPSDRRRPDRSDLDPDLSGEVGLPAMPPPRAQPEPQFELAA